MPDAVVMVAKSENVNPVPNLSAVKLSTIKAGHTASHPPVQEACPFASVAKIVQRSSVFI